MGSFRPIKAPKIDENLGLVRRLDVKGELANISFKGKHPKLQDLQKAVDGPIEVVAIPTCFYAIWMDSSEDYIMLVHEEGRILQLPANQYASAIVGQKILGNVVIMVRRLFK